jgi:hypothetical protein
MTASYAAQGRTTSDVKDNGTKVTIDDKLPLEDRQLIVRRALNTDQQDAQDYLERVRARFDRCAKILCTCMAPYRRLAHAVVPHALTAITPDDVLLPAHLPA